MTAIAPVFLASKYVAQVIHRMDGKAVRGAKNIGLTVVDTLAGHVELRLRDANSSCQLQAATK